MPTHTSVAPDGTTIAWTRSGEGEPVVLVHGITENGTSWGQVAERLAETNDVIVVGEAGLSRPHLVGHSLGGAVVSVAGAAIPAATVTNVDQPLHLAAFKDQLGSVEPSLRDQAAFPLVIEALFDQMMGDRLPEDERARLGRLRSANQDVVLGVWHDILTSSVSEIEAIVDGALAPYQTTPVPYLSIFGIDPGPTYSEWLVERIPSAIVEQWPEHGHYPHLVDPDRFITRLHQFWESNPR